MATTKMDDLLKMAQAIASAKGKTVKLKANPSRMDKGTSIYQATAKVFSAPAIVEAINKFAGDDIGLDKSEVSRLVQMAITGASQHKKFDANDAVLKIALVGNDLCARIKQSITFGKDIEVDQVLVPNWQEKVKSNIDQIEMEKNVGIYVEMRQRFLKRTSEKADDYDKLAVAAGDLLQKVQEARNAASFMATQDMQVAKQHAVKAKEAAERVELTVDRAIKAYQQFKDEDFEPHRNESALRTKYKVTSEGLASRDEGVFTQMTRCLGRIDTVCKQLAVVAQNAQNLADEAAAFAMTSEEQLQLYSDKLGPLLEIVNKNLKSLKNFKSLSGLEATPPSVILEDLKKVEEPKLSEAKQRQKMLVPAKLKKLPSSMEKMRNVVMLAHESVSSFKKPIAEEILIKLDLSNVDEVLIEIDEIWHEVQEAEKTYTVDSQKLLEFCNE